MPESCPCGTGKTYHQCCGAFISHQKQPATPEALMRSRYTAYTEANTDYILETMRSPAADHFDKEEARIWAQQLHWLDLRIVQARQSENEGYVEFIARYRTPHQEESLHEISYFKREEGQWFYISGTRPKPPSLSTKIGRNDPCSCGSGKKSKKCCGVS